MKEHKNAGKGKSRAVYFPPDVLAVLKRLAASRPTGLLLRNTRDVARKRDTVYDRVTCARADAGIDHFNIYCLRATFITNALIRDVPVAGHQTRHRSWVVDRSIGKFGGLADVPN